MRPHDRIMRIDLPATSAQVTDQLFARIELRARRLIAVKISDETNAEPDVVQIIAVNMAAIDLPSPSVTNFDLSIS